MSDSQFTSTALGAIRLAQENAAKLGHSYVGSENLLLGLAGQEFSPAAMALRRAGADSQALRAAIAQRVGTGVPAKASFQGLTPNCCLAIQGAVQESRRLGQGGGKLRASAAGSAADSGQRGGPAAGPLRGGGRRAVPVGLRLPGRRGGGPRPQAPAQGAGGPSQRRHPSAGPVRPGPDPHGRGGPP